MEDLFIQGNYAELEKIYHHIKDNDVRTGSGINALDEEFYNGLWSNIYQVPPKFKVWDDDEKSLKKWMVQFPTSPAPRIAYAKLLLEHGWAYRGYATSDNVGKMDWKPFQQYALSSQQYLKSIKKLSASDPQWYVVSLQTALVTDKDEASYQSLLNEAATKFPEYYGIYYSALTHYLPMWGGSFDALDHLANFAAEKTKQKDGDELYARIYWGIEGEAANGRFNWVKDTKLDWARMKVGLNGIIAKYPSDWNINHYAYLACTAKDQPQTALLFKQINGYVKENWKSRFSYGYCQAYASNTLEEYNKDLNANGMTLDPVARQKYHEYMAAFKAYESKTNALGYKYDSHDTDDYQQKYNEYIKAMSENQ
ncbi:hypothetical protein HYN46_14470 [Aquirhabdus parva]|uniref:DUF4034 domain-containing protein n=1 Tax=Aquirhabdus parva TaxID=2283318 RepID=A0A345P9H7_9GAMM|nr:hypothetical protein HYN46_14470 [Aquirhabdus parva]